MTGRSPLGSCTNLLAFHLANQRAGNAKVLAATVLIANYTRLCVVEGLDFEQRGGTGALVRRARLAQHETFAALFLHFLEHLVHLLAALKKSVIDDDDVVGLVGAILAEHAFEQLHAVLEWLGAVRRDVEDLIAAKSAQARGREHKKHRHST